MKSSLGSIKYMQEMIYFKLHFLPYYILSVFELGSSNGDHSMAIMGESWPQNMKART
jgi:hypothetical protein